MKFFLNKNYSKKAFTLVELVVAIFISSILFVFLFSFVVDSLGEIRNSKNKTQFFGNFSSLDIKLKNISEIFPNYSLVKNNTYGFGSDIILFKNREGNKGVAFGIVNVDKMKFDKNYDIYQEKVLGYIELSQNQLNELNSNSDKIYDYPVFKDNIFENIFVRDLQAKLYNVQKIIEISMILNSSYNPSFDGDNRANISKKGFFKVVLDF